MKRTRVSRGRANTPRRPDFYRLDLQLLEQRLPPGDALIGALLGSWWLGDISGRTPTPRAPELALVGASSWVRRVDALPVTIAAPQTAEATAPVPVAVHQSNQAENAARSTGWQPDSDVLPSANSSPLAFRNHGATTSGPALPIAASAGPVSAPSAGLPASTTAGLGSRPAVPVGGTNAPSSPGSASFLNFLNPLRTISTAGQPVNPLGQNVQSTAAAAVSAPNVATGCAAQQSAADPWGGDPRTTVRLHADAANGSGPCAAPVTRTDQGQGAPPPDGTPDNVLVNDPGEDGTSAQDTQSETTLVAAGTNVVVGYNDSFLYNGSSPHFTGLSRSTDSGSSFRDLGGLPNNATGGDAGDPVLARDNVTGRTYLATLNLNASGNIDIFRSDDNFQTYLSTTLINRSGGFLDKEWIAVDNAPGAGQGNVYVVVRDFGSGNGIFLFRSTDQGNTFTPSGGIQIVSGGSGNVQGAWVTTGPDHAVYALWYDATSSTPSIKIRKSTDQGQTFGPAVTVTTLSASLGVNGDLGLGGFRSNAFPQAVVNPINNNIYVAFDNRGAGSDRADVFFTQSTDGGATWTTPVKVNDDTTTRDQWQPVIAVNPSGSRVGVFWYDRRNDSANNLIDRYGAIGTVAGGSVIFDPNMRISDTSFPPAFGHDPVVNGVYMGDYDQAVADSSYFYLTWGDNRSPSRGHTGNNQDVRFAKIPQVVAGPSVVSTTPSGGTFGNVSSMRVSFDEQIDPDTFTPDKILFLNPTTGQIPVTDVEPVAGSNDRQFDISFDSQTALGTYTMVIGPDVEDINGNPMDQNHNGTPGEVPDDAYVARFTIQAPRITASTPAFGTVLTPQAVNSVRVTFNEPMDAATFTPAKVTSFVGPRGNITVTAVTPVAGSNNTQFDISFAPQAFTGYYTMVIGPNIQDPAGHAMDQPYIEHFGIQGPRITTNPQLGSFAPGQTRSVRVAFNEAMNPATFTPSTVQLVGPGGPVTITAVTPVGGTNNTQFDIQFAALTAAGLYHLAVGPDIRDTFGNEMDQNQNLVPGEVPGDQFTATLSVLGPRITASTPFGGIAPQTVNSVQVTFSVSMDPTTFTVDKIAGFTRTNGSVVTNLLSTITTITPVTGSNNTRFNINFQNTGATGRYVLLIGPDVRDTFNNEMDQNQDGIPGEVPGDEYTATFTLQGPRITASTPSGSIAPQLVNSVQVTFNESMNPASFTPDQVVSFTRTNGTAVTDLLATITTVVPVAGSNNTRFNINFQSTGATGLYTLVIGPHIQDTFGNEMDQNNNLIPGEDPGDQFTATFSLSGPRITTNPQLGSFAPGQTRSVRVAFNEAMDPTTFTPGAVQLVGPGGPVNVTAVTPVAGTNNSQFDIQFDLLTATGLYALTVGPHIQDAFGNEMDQNQNLVPGEDPGDQFTATLGVLGPRVNSSSPSGTILGQVNSVHLVFNEPIDPATFTPDKIASFTGPAGPIDIAGVFPSGSNTQFDITFASQVQTGRYTMVVGPDVEDYFGNEMDQNGDLVPGEVPGDQYTVTFGIAGPRILSSTPIGNNLPGMIHSLRVTFNESMDPATFTPDKVASFKGPDGSDLPVTDVQPVPLTADTQFDISFDPAGTAGTYTMVIGPDIHDLFGNAMDQNGNLIPGEIPGDQYTATFTVQGPRILSSSPSGTVRAPVDHVQVTFNESMNPDTFTPDQVVSFRGPGGDIPVLDVSPVPDSNNTQFTISFDPQNGAGTYTMVIGPDIQDNYGNRTGQNYTATFQVVSTLIVGYFTDYNANSTGPQASITEAGYFPEQITNISTFDLSSLSILMVDESFNGPPSAALVGRLPAIQTWVQGGGIFMVHDRGLGTTGGGSPFLLGVPNPNVVRAPGPMLDVIPPGDNPVVNGPHGHIDNTTLNGGSLSTTSGYVQSATLPADSLNILSSDPDVTHVAALSYSLGAGFVYYSGIPLDYYLDNDGPPQLNMNFKMIYTPNVLNYLGRLTEGGTPHASRPEAGAFTTAIVTASGRTAVTAGGAVPARSEVARLDAFFASAQQAGRPLAFSRGKAVPMTTHAGTDPLTGDLLDGGDIVR